MRILISGAGAGAGAGAGVAGPVLAYWLTRHGFSVTVVERAPTLRKTGGHAVDLFAPATNISEQMGVLFRYIYKHGRNHCASHAIDDHRISAESRQVWRMRPMPSI